MVLNILSLERVSSTWKDIQALHGNSTPFYVINLNILRVWYHLRIFESISFGYHGLSLAGMGVPYASVMGVFHTLGCRSISMAKVVVRDLSRRGSYANAHG